MPLRLRTFLLCALGCVGATAAIAAIPALRVAYDNNSAHVAVETTATLVGVMVAFLLLGRVERTRLLDELTLVSGLTLLALSNLLFGTLPSMVAIEQPQIVTWGSLIASAAAAILIGASSFLPQRPLLLSARGAPRLAMAISGGLFLLIVFAVEGLWTVLPQAVHEVPTAAGGTRVVGHPAVLAIQLSVAVIYAIAACGFYRRCRQTGDELSGWLALASILASAARLNYFLYPSLYGKSVYTGDAFRLAFYLVLLIGGAREVASYWTSMIEAAQLDERRRIARDLHDGLAQEIAFIARNAKLLGETNDDRELAVRIVAAAERARLESRRVIAALTSRLDEPLDRALAEAVKDVAKRYGATLEFRIAAGIVLPSASREAIVRIASEAVANAATHSGADHVRIELERRDGGTRLRVVDRGRGFDAASRSAQGFGLISMRERAEALGGRFQIRSQAGRGTQIEVVL